MEISAIKELEDEGELNLIRIKPNQLEDLDFAYFYSEPLVKTGKDIDDPSKTVLVPMYEHLDFKNEYNRLKSILKQNKKEMVI